MRTASPPKRPNIVKLRPASVSPSSRRDRRSQQPTRHLFALLNPFTFRPQSLLETPHIYSADQPGSLYFLQHPLRHPQPDKQPQPHHRRPKPGKYLSASGTTTNYSAGTLFNLTLVSTSLWRNQHLYKRKLNNQEECAKEVSTPSYFHHLLGPWKP